MAVNDTPAESPLSGMLVVEFAGVLAGPTVGMFLAELGARVLKVENPATGGDVTRAWTLGSEDGADSELPSPYFAAVNWGKESVALDFGQPDELAAARGLARRADVVLVSYKRGDAERFGLDYPAVSADNPRVVYGEITAYGPDDDRVGYDAVIQAETGFMHLNGTPDGPPTKLPVALMDVLAGHQLKQAVLLGLLVRERTGRGTRVSVSLVRSGLAALVNQAGNWLVAGRNPQRLGSGHPNIVPYGTSYAARDGERVVLAVGTDRQFEALCRALGAPYLADDERFRTNPGRVKHRAELESLLAERVAGQSRDALLAALASAGVPSGPILDVSEALSRPEALPLLLEAKAGGADTGGTEAGEADADGAGEHASDRRFAGLRSVAFEPGVGPYRPRPLAEPPRLGQHTEEVLAEFGMGFHVQRD